MDNLPKNDLKFASLFPTEMAGGAMAYRAEEGHEILYASDGLIRLFECVDFSDFMDYVGGSYDGIIDEAQRGSIQKEISLQRKGGAVSSGYVFYHIHTKSGQSHRVVNHWTYLDKEGIFLSQIFLHLLDNVGSELDPVTGLYGRMRFYAYVEGVNKELQGTDQDEYAIIYLNILRFKLLNLHQGVDRGDACLRAVADVLSRVFSDAFISRIADDHFVVFMKADEAMERIEEAEKLFRDTYGDQFKVDLRFGVFRFTLGPELEVETALARARIAADSIKHDTKKQLEFYSEDMGELAKLRDHIISRIDEAIEKRWIKVYYQPVIRSVTGSLCGMESLVRWIDPEYGFLNPGQFISVLEYGQVIHKLDCFVIEEACRCIHERVKRRQPMVPVSVNFSRLDFLMCDMLQVLEDAVAKYDIPRDYIHVEITESMIASDEELMRRMIDSFRGAGYEIWMDDFGSGYSSLTLLKDYSFDMLKLDMRFLRPFTETSQNIIRSVVTMAKSIGMNTLAEGVETEEQLSFLREIGCEQIQGFYYGKPEPIDDMFAHLEEKGIEIELRKWRKFYETAGFYIRDTEMPLEIVEVEGYQYKTLFMNRAYRDQIMPAFRTLTLDEIDQILYRSGSMLVQKYDKIVEQLRGTKKEHVFYYTGKGAYYRFRGQMLIEREGRGIMRGTLINISMDQDTRETERLNAKLRELNLLFEVVLLMDVEKNVVRSLLSGFTEEEDPVNDIYSDMRESTRFLVQRIGFPTERSRMLAFMDADTMRQRVEASNKGYISDVFRFKQSDGSYQWKEVSLMMMPGTNGHEFLYCTRPYVEYGIGTDSTQRKEEDKPDLSGLFEVTNLWQNMLWNSDIRFFWKDRDRRYRVVSQSFLDFFGFDSVNEIIGKTDKELHWLLNEAACERDDLACLGFGTRTSDSPMQVVSKGVVHHLLVNIMPVYQNNDIVGIAGYYADYDEEMNKAHNRSEYLRTDPVTKLMNSHAFVDTLMDYAEHYSENNTDFGIILLQNRSHRRILETYGEVFANRVLEVMAEKLLAYSGTAAVLARMKASVFAVLLYTDDPSELKEIGERIRKGMDAIREVDGNSVTIRMDYAVRCRSEEGVTDEGMYEMTLRELLEKRENL